MISKQREPKMNKEITIDGVDVSQCPKMRSKARGIKCGKVQNDNGININ